MTLFESPQSAAEDERFISKGYQRWLLPFIGAAPIAVAWYDQKWVLPVSSAIGLVMLHEIGGRLYDLCIRLRRTNSLLSQQNSN
jgi:hypothetical protein